MGRPQASMQPVHTQWQMQIAHYAMEHLPMERCVGKTARRWVHGNSMHSPLQTHRAGLTMSPMWKPAKRQRLEGLLCVGVLERDEQL